MQMILGSALCDLDLEVLGQGQISINVLSCNVNSSPPKPMDVATSSFAGAEVTIVLYCGTQPQGQGQILYYLVNTLPEPLDVATENFAGAYVT